MDGQCFIFQANASACTSILIEDITMNLSYLTDLKQTPNYQMLQWLIYIAGDRFGLGNEMFCTVQCSHSIFFSKYLALLEFLY